MIAIAASEVPPRTTPSNYPEPFASRMEGRVKRPVSDQFRLRNFGVNLTTLAPGARSALHHVHSAQDEFVYILAGEATIVSDDADTIAEAGMCAGFCAGGVAHHLENRSDRPVIYLEIGDRSAGDEVSYPADDLVGLREAEGWSFTHKDGTPYP